MKSDGAHEGLLPEAAMHRAMGSEPDARRLSMVELGGWIEAAPDGELKSYDDAGRVLAKALLGLLERDATLAERDLLEIFRSPPLALAHASARVNHASSFMAGWAWNAARAVLGYPPAPNPALRHPFFLAIPIKEMAS